MTRFTALDVRCRHCGAVPGARCRRISVQDGQAVLGAPRKVPHLDRVDSARRETMRRRQMRRRPRSDPQ